MIPPHQYDAAAFPHLFAGTGVSPATATCSLPAIVALGLAAALAILWARLGFAQQVDPISSVTNGSVYAVARDSGTICVGSYFTQVGPATGSGAPIEAESGR